MYSPSFSLCLSNCVFPEANPEKFNSRFRNKMFYAGVSVPDDFLSAHTSTDTQSFEPKHFLPVTVCLTHRHMLG